MKKIVIASDSFKGSLTSSQVAETAAIAIRQIYPDATVIKIAAADGGEGTIAALRSSVGGTLIKTPTIDPLARPHEAEYLMRNGKAIVELASSSGITLLKKGELNPMLTTTAGTGMEIADAMRRGCRDITVALGGSATSDGGMGVLQALGFRFEDKKGQALPPCGKSLKEVVCIDDSTVSMATRAATFTAACDVDNPFYGEKGAAHVFAPQKGANEQMVEDLDRGLENLCKRIAEFNGRDISSLPGAGAAGGVAGGMAGLLNATIISGAEMILNYARLDDALRHADLVITGEGCVDQQTIGGKLPGIVAKRARQKGVPTLVLCGRNKLSLAQEGTCGITVLAITPENMPTETAMLTDVACKNLAEALAAWLKRNKGQHQ